MDAIGSIKKGKQLYAILKRDIEEGKYKKGEKLPSIRVLAQQYTLSKNTVNAVVGLLVNEGLAVVRDGRGTYVADAKHETRMIGIILMDFCKTPCVELDVLKYIQINLPSNYYLGIVNAANRFDALAEGIQRLKNMGAAGYIVIPPRNAPDTRNAKRAVDLLGCQPTVLINREIEGLDADVFSMNLGKGIDKAFEYLEMGGKRNTCILLHDAKKFLQEEMEAYIRHCRKKSVSPRVEWLIDWNADSQVTGRKLEAVLPEIDSIIGPDMLLEECQDIIHRSGKRIPEELSVIGINNTIHSSMFFPPLTSISYPAERVGRHAITRLVERIEGMDTSPGRVTNFEPELLIRST